MVPEVKRKRQEVIVFSGNTGLGKSIIAAKLAKKGYVIVNMDSIQTMISGGEYGLYDVSKKDIYHDIEIAGIVSALRQGYNIVIDRTNVDKARRRRYIELIKECKTDVDIICYSFGVGDEDICLKNRMKNSRGISQSSWNKVYHYMKNSYEEPTEDEGFMSIVKMPVRYEVHAFDFDGYIVENEYPMIGRINEKVVQKMNELYDSLSNYIVIWTCRHGDSCNLMKEFLLKEKIPFDSINRNPFFETGSRKLFAHVYYDDRNRA